MEYIEKHFPFFHYFDTIIYSYEVGMIKPDKAIFCYALDQIQSSAEECAFIDDTVENVLSAEALGIRSFQFITPHYLQESGERNKRSSINHVLLNDSNIME